VTQYLLSHGLEDQLVPLLGTIIADVKLSIAPPRGFSFGHRWFKMNGSVVTDVHRMVPLKQHFPEIANLLASRPSMKGLVISGH
jgi:hypothetical protein